MIKYYEDGTYNGSFRFGKCHGKGIFTWINGDKYDGEWVKDEGPSGFAPANELTKNLIELGFSVRRFKTDNGSGSCLFS